MTESDGENENGEIKVEPEEAIRALQDELTRVNANLLILQDNPRIEPIRAPRLPRFITHDPALWFIQIEAAFNSARITSEGTRAEYLIAELDPEILLCARDIIITTPRPANIFSKIKQRILAAYSVSSKARLRQLLKGDFPSDGKPSLILTRLRSLGGAQCNEEVIKSVFLDQLPVSTKSILAVSRVTDLQDLADLADKVYETTNASYTCSTSTSEKQTPQPRSSSSSRNFESQLESIMKRVNAIDAKMSKNNKKRSYDRSRSKSRTESGFGKL
ncbi:uncharacterized protein LOC122499611 [Leptopilina heterotoma]|uniref:uncharacterized protein LOC122499611 n=1 Tax=Leptopilina heterotoma TaxID=63436 RepID=UPI001CA99A6E|nr:uncharacterized protein LOC122499611 [Leptopilina heterotoma]